MTGRPRVEVFADAAAACEAAARLVASARTIALSGGKTAEMLFPVLARAPIDWASKELFWGDERCVPPDHPDSNYGLARRLLLEPAGIPAPRVWRMRGEDEPDKAAADYEALLRSRVPDGVDLALLGIGADGHTASLFPGSSALGETVRWTAVSAAPSGQARLTMTLPFLSKTRLCAALALGAGKREVLARALDEPSARLPIQRALTAAPAVVLADAQAAANRVR